MTSRIVTTGSAVETRVLGRRLGELLSSGDVILLEGELGSGKTTLTQGIGEALGADEVSSPTFILVADHRGTTTFRHVDLYRLGVVTNLDDLGIEDTLGVEGVTVVEWPERCPTCWPAEYLRIRISAEDDYRTFTIEPSGSRYQSIADRISDAPRD